MSEHSKGIGITITYNTEQRNDVIVPDNPSPSVSDRLERFNINTQEYELLSPMKQPRAGHGQITYEDSLFIFGGTNGIEIFNSLEEYNTLTDESVIKSSMQTKRTFFQYCNDGHYIYVIGGLTSNSFGETSVSNSVERYNILTDEWESLANMPDSYSVMMGTAFFYNNKIYVLSGYKNAFNTFLDKVLIYDASLNEWTTEDISDPLFLSLYKRVLPFSFIKNDIIYVLNGLYYYQTEPLVDKDGNVVKTYPPIAQNLSDAFIYNISASELDRGEKFFSELPRARYAGATSVIDNQVYYVGGINKKSNTLRFVEKSDLSSTPFDYDDFDRLLRGRSNHGMTSHSDEYGDFLYISGGIIGKNNENFLKVDLEPFPSTINLDGQQSCQIKISVSDENEEYPENVYVRLSALSGNDDRFIFTADTLNVNNGYALATMLPRAADRPDAYGVSVAGSIIDSVYFGETDLVVQEDSIDSSTGTTSSGGSTLKTSKVVLPGEYKPVYKYETVISASQITSGSFLNVSNLGGFLSLGTVSENNIGKSASINYTNSQKWLPIIDPIIETNEGTADDVRDEIDRISRERPWGGTALYDALYYNSDVLTSDASGYKKITYAITDGDDNESRHTKEEVVDSLKSIDNNPVPLVSSILSIIPTELYLSQGVRKKSSNIESITDASGGDIAYVLSSDNLEKSVKSVILSRGFIGSGTFVFEVDMQDEVLLEYLHTSFTFEDPDAKAKWKYSIAGEDKVFGLPTELLDANSFINLNNIFARYIKVFIEFSMDIGIDVYNAERMIPAKFTEFTASYHKKSETLMFLETKDIKETAQQIIVTIDCTRPFGSDVLVGVSDHESGNWEDYDSPSTPSVENSSKIIIPIRDYFNSETYSLEPLISIDGYIYSSTYGKWSPDATVEIFKNGTELVDSSLYHIIPEKGKVVFTTHTEENYVLAVKNKNKLSVAVKVTNRVSGNPVLISGIGYMYTTLKSIGYSATRETLIPQVQSIILSPVHPNKDSIIRVDYSYTDVSGRPELTPTADPKSPTFKNCTQIEWYVNNVIQPDIQNMKEWDNSDFQLASSGDDIFAVVKPAATKKTGQSIESIFGVKARSLPITLS